ncbi:hypothetical protein HYX04_00925 [Candidatus Woesearchaeota archaeon]|nr:hypothetical protein [Candidatus Woesearchaeota archaeon]
MAGESPYINPTVQKLEALVTSYKGVASSMDMAQAGASKSGNMVLVNVILNDRAGLDKYFETAVKGGNLDQAIDYIDVYRQRYPTPELELKHRIAILLSKGEKPAKGKKYSGELSKKIRRYVVARSRLQEFDVGKTAKHFGVRGGAAICNIYRSIPYLNEREHKGRKVFVRKK